MSMRRLLLLPLACAGACAGADARPAAVTTPAPTGTLVRITVVSAEIAGAMPGGEPWDSPEAASAGATARVAPPLDRYLAAHPELTSTLETLGAPIDAERTLAEARSSRAADPMVLLELGDSVVRGPVRPRAFRPLWSFETLAVVGVLHGRAGVAPDAPVRIHVVDYDGALAFDPIGTTVLTAEQLLARRIHDLGPFGSVHRLLVEVDVLDAPADPGPHASRFAIDARGPWTDTGLEILAGQRVVIEAADEVCSKGDSPDHCSGPEGQRTPSDHNLPGFGALGHGALVAALGDTRFPVGRHLRFVAPASGRLRLGINDRDTANNRGAYAVRVLVYPVP